MSWVDIPEGSPFPIGNLPFGAGNAAGSAGRCWVAIGDQALDLAACQDAGLFDGCAVPGGAFATPSLNAFLGAGPETWSAVRYRLTELLGEERWQRTVGPHLQPQSSVRMAVPVAVGDYVDFYSSIHHATNLGRLFRPNDEPLLPNWRRLPVGYHGRAGSLVADGADIVRPCGHRLVDGEPVVGPTMSLDIELELGTIVGAGSALGTPIPIGDAGQHLFGLCLVNDWSARDIQAFEYQPLGPFLGKSFATSLAPWVVPFEALAPFRVPNPTLTPEPAEYLRGTEPWTFDIDLEVAIDSAEMRAAGISPAVISRTSFADMYWTPAQQLAHLTVNGAAVRPGDLFASGTISGPEPGTEGSLIELTWRGQRPIELPDGTTRSFLLDGDRITLRGWAGRDPATRIGLGSLSGTIVPSPGGPR